METHCHSVAGSQVFSCYNTPHYNTLAYQGVHSAKQRTVRDFFRMFRRSKIKYTMYSTIKNFLSVWSHVGVYYKVGAQHAVICMCFVIKVEKLNENYFFGVAYHLIYEKPFNVIETSMWWKQKGRQRRAPPHTLSPLLLTADWLGQ